MRFGQEIFIKNYIYTFQKRRIDRNKISNRI